MKPLSIAFAVACLVLAAFMFRSGAGVRGIAGGVFFVVLALVLYNNGRKARTRR